MSGFQRPHCLDRAACTARKPTTHCRGCAAKAVARDPEWRARQAAGAKAKAAEPEHRVKLVARSHAALAKARAVLGVEGMREQGRRIHAISRQPEHLATLRASAADRGRKRTATVLAWCPADRRDDYRHLIYVKGFRAAEARAIIEDAVRNELAVGRRIVRDTIAAMEAREARRKAQEY